MFAKHSPEYMKWLGYVADTSRTGDYDEARRQRQGYVLTPNNFFVSTTLFDEGGRKRDVITTNESRHSIQFLGYISLFDQDTRSHTEFLFLDDGRIFEFRDPPADSDTQRTRDFIPIELAAKSLEEAIQSKPSH